MTLICPSSGPSTQKAGTPAVVFLTGEAITEAVSALFPGSAFLDMLLFAAGQTFTLSTFCATDPPTIPSFSAGDILDILQANPILGLPGYLKLAQLVQNAAWYVFCQCTSGTASLPAAPTYPAGAPVINPPSGTGGMTSGTSCWDHSVTGALTTGAFRMDLLPAGTLAPSGLAHTNGAVTIPSGVTGVRLSISEDTVGANATGGLVEIFAYDSTGAFIAGGGGLYAANSGLSTPNTYTTPYVFPKAGTTPVYWTCTVGDEGSGTPTNNFTAEIELFCGGATPFSLSSPCCPPDPSISGLLAQLQAGINYLISGLTTPISSYAESSVHAGLTGSGNFVLGAGTIALKVAITATAPGTVGEEVGDPTRYFDAGVVTFSTAEGNFQSTRIEHTPQLVVVPLLADTFHYTLGGTTVTATELVRGP